MNIILTAFLLIAPCFAQDFEITYNTKNSSTSWEEFDFPEPLTLFTVDMKKEKVEIEGLTLIEVWSKCCGGEPEIWAKSREIERTYAARGLKTLSINFENGTMLPEQIERVKQYLAQAEPPGKLLLDPMGDVIDLLKVSGFPSYILVSPEKKVFFLTRGKDPEGVQAMLEELERRLPPA